MKFVDEVDIEIKAGKGGNGIASFRKEKYIEFGGPDGGDGGDGGNIYLKGTKGLNTLADFRTKKKFDAQNGENGMSKNKTGRKGDDLDILVPLGTIVCNSDNGVLISELVEDGQKLLVAKGGKHGFGNLRFKSSTNRAPRKTTPGEKGYEAEVVLRLKILADAGLVGFPNAGKSSLLRKISAAKPKVADYPFTTLDPKLGVVRKGDEEIVVADIPGLIEDAHVGSGLGFKFLKHIERCHSLIHVIDITNEDLVKSYNTIINELKSYDEDLVNKNKIIVLNKCDLLKKEEIDKIRIDFENFINLKIHLISTISGEGIDQLINEILKLKNL